MFTLKYSRSSCDIVLAVRPVRDYSVLVATLLHQHSVLTGRTEPIFELGLHFDLSYTPVKASRLRCDATAPAKSVHGRPVETASCVSSRYIRRLHDHMLQ